MFKAFCNVRSLSFNSLEWVLSHRQCDLSFSSANSHDLTLVCKSITNLIDGLTYTLITCVKYVPLPGDIFMWYTMHIKFLHYLDYSYLRFIFIISHVNVLYTSSVSALVTWRNVAAWTLVSSFVRPPAIENIWKCCFHLVQVSAMLPSKQNASGGLSLSMFWHHVVFNTRPWYW